MRNTRPVVPGQTIADKYRVEGVLGRGAMGIVLSARHLGLDQMVAIKLLSSDAVQVDAMARERFLREARLAARIRSEHVCRVLDTGALDDGTPYLVMEYLEGIDLAAELTNRGFLEPLEATQYLRQACAALAVAHAAGVIHRDLKPANMFLTRQLDGSRLLKVLDFGVSKALVEGKGEVALTRTSALVGSPLYMSPEQLNSSRTVDERTDIWALGTILFELISGRPPFVGDTIPQLVNAILNFEPPSFEALQVRVPHGLEPVIRRALSKSRTQRFGSVSELSLALAPFAPNPAESVSGVVFRVESDARAAAPDVHTRSTRITAFARSQHEGNLMTLESPDAAPRRRSKWLRVAVISVAAGAIALGIARYVFREPEPATSVNAATAESLVVPAAPAASPANEPVLGAVDVPLDAPEAEPDEPPPSADVAEKAEEAASAPIKAAAPALVRSAPKPAAAVTAPPKPSVDPLEIPGFGGRR